MEYITEIITAFFGVLTTILSSSVVYYKGNKKSKELENKLKQKEVDNEVIKQWEKLYNEEKEKNKTLEERLAELYKHRKIQFDEIGKLRQDLSKKDIDIIGLNFSKCVINNCNRRKPKRNYEEGFEVLVEEEEKK